MHECIMYAKNSIIFREEHFSILKELLGRLRRARITARPTKCFIYKRYTCRLDISKQKLVQNGLYTPHVSPFETQIHVDQLCPSSMQTKLKCIPRVSGKA